jgi:hypothetical protein
MGLQALIEQANRSAASSGGLIGHARCQTRMVRVQRVTQNRSSLPSHYRVDVRTLPDGKRMAKAEWQKELAQ